MKCRFNPSISIVMATCNGQAYLRQQLDSLLEQTHPADEILILDDGSQDGTITLLKDYADQHDSIRLVLNERNLGVNANFSKGLRMCHGDLVFISDQDDIWASNKIERMLDAWQGEDLVYSNAIIIDGNGKKLFESEAAYFKFQPVQGKNPAYFLFNNCISGHNIMATKTLIRTATKNNIPQHLMFDQWLGLLASLMNGVGYVSDPLCFHRIHSSNTHNNLSLKKNRKLTPRDSFIIKSHSLQTMIEQLNSLPLDKEPIKPILKALEDILTSFEKKTFSLRTFFILLNYRHDLFPNCRPMKKIRLTIRLCAGLRFWRLSLI
jgi:glycosyltransferase involved in cell wall biosynthesis